MIDAIAKALYDERGYVVVPTEVPEATLSEARAARGPEQPEVYRYNKAGHRWFETWRTSQAVRDIAYSKPVLDAIRAVTGCAGSPRPFQCILFDRPSAQPLHHDAVHFDSVPRGQIFGAWVALERMDEENGPLCYVPGSHRPGFTGWQAMGLEAVPVGGQERAYRRYEEICSWSNGEREAFLCDPGTAFVWGVDLLHGGMPVTDPERTRWSLVTHYYLDSMQYAHAPMFGTPERPYKKTGRWFDRAGQVHPYERNRVRPMLSYGS